MKKKKIIITLSIVISVVVISTYFWLSEFQQKIIFTNNSDIIIDLAEIKYCDKTLNLNNIVSKKSVSRYIASVGDCDFDVKITFSDNTIIEKNNLGYITDSDGSDSVFQITKQKELIFFQEH